MMSLQTPQTSHTQYNSTLQHLPYPYQFDSKQFPLTTNSIQSLSPQQEKSGKFCNNVNMVTLESPEMGPESDDEISNVTSPDLIGTYQYTAPMPMSMPTYDYNTLLSSVVNTGYNFLATLPVPPSLSMPNPLIPSLISSPNPFISNSNSMPNQPTQRTQDTPVKLVQFVPKFNNHAKGNFYISKEKIYEMVHSCSEPFITNECNDEKLAFGYFKESVAMQINDKQIRVIRTCKGDIIVINIDLHYNNGDIMYLIATENDSLHKHRVQWKIIDFMPANEIQNVYGINESNLPKSSRNMYHFRHGLSVAPVNVDINVIYETDFSALPGKKSKRNTNESCVCMNESDFQYYCEQSWDNGLMIPCVVIKGKRQWIEWKKFISIGCDRFGEEQWIGISLRYYDSHKQWKIECMDYDAGRIFYQYRLVGCDNIESQYQISYSELQKCITTSMYFPQKRWNNRY